MRRRSEGVRERGIEPRVWCLVGVLLLAGCSKPPVETKAEAPKAASGQGRFVVIDAAAQKGAGVVVEQIDTRSVPQVLRANGRITVNENRTWRVGAVTEGRIIRVYANAGDHVEVGQVLARMHSHDIHEARALFRKAQSDFARSKTVEAYSVRARDRAKRLFELKAASLEQVEHAETELKNAQNATQTAQVEVDRTKQHLVEFLQISTVEPTDHHEGEREPDEDLIPIKAPAAGTILSRSVTPGTVVASSGDAFVISDLASVWMIAAVNEEHLSRLRPGMRARVFVQAYPNQPFTGTIAKLGEELDPATRTVKTRIDLANARGRLRPEMYATAEIETGGTEPALFVPEGAMQEVNGKLWSLSARPGTGLSRVRCSWGAPWRERAKSPRASNRANGWSPEAAFF